MLWRSCLRNPIESNPDPHESGASGPTEFRMRNFGAKRPLGIQATEVFQNVGMKLGVSNSLLVEQCFQLFAQRAQRGSVFLCLSLTHLFQVIVQLVVFAEVNVLVIADTHEILPLVIEP